MILVMDVLSVLAVRLMYDVGGDLKAVSAVASPSASRALYVSWVPAVPSLMSSVQGHHKFRPRSRKKISSFLFWNFSRLSVVLPDTKLLLSLPPDNTLFHNNI